MGEQQQEQQPAFASAQATMDVEGGFGTITVHPGGDAIAEIEKFAQVTRQAVGHVFAPAYLESLAEALCRPGVACSKPTVGLPCPSR